MCILLECACLYRSSERELAARALNPAFDAPLQQPALHHCDRLLLQVDVAKLTTLCQSNEKVTRYLLADDHKSRREDRVARRFKTYTERCQVPFGKTQMSFWWKEGEEDGESDHAVYIPKAC